MKWVQFLLILFLSPDLLLLFQTDQVIGIDWLIFEDAVVTKSEKDDSSIDLDLWFDLKRLSHSSSRVKPFFQLASRLPTWLSHFQGTSPFWRPPPTDWSFAPLRPEESERILFWAMISRNHKEVISYG